MTGIARSTGAHFVLPLCIGLAIGRVGCFLSGLEDDTYGTATSLPWGIDFGDGTPRHPTQLYEIGFALIFALLVPPLKRRSEESGDLFRLFMVGYFAFRFLEEFARESAAPYLGLSIYQIGCIIGLVYYLRDGGVRMRLLRMARGRATSETPSALPET